MDKRTGINIGLLAIVIVLVIIALNSGEEQTDEPTSLTSLSADTISRIEILRRDQQDDFIFTREGDNWVMQSPLNFKVNPSRLSAVLKLLKVKTHGQVSPDSSELGQFDLADPPIIVRLNEHEFRFGDTDAIDQRRYIMYKDAVYLTRDYLFKQLTVNAAFFADTKLLPTDIEIASIDFPDSTLRNVDDTWQLQPLMDIKPDQLKRIAFNWQNALAISASRYSEPEEHSSITIHTVDGKTIEFVIVQTEPHLVLGREDLGIQYHMGSDETGKLLPQEQTAPAETDTPE